MRSRTGCKTCRQRKLKCDEARPVCGQCTKASRECIPSEGVTFRHQQNASMNGAVADSSGLDKFFKYTDTFHKDHVWLDIPSEISFYHITDPYTQLEPSIDSSAGRVTPIRNRPTPHGIGNRLWSHNKQPLHSPSFGLDTLSSVAAGDPYMLSSPHDTSGRNYLPSPASVNFHTPPESRPTTGHTPMTLDSPMTVTTSHTPLGPHTPIDPILTSPQNGARLEARRGDEMFPTAMEDEHERAFLLRHYAEVPGRGMDLFDCGRYFSYHVPTKVWSDPLLQAAACAYAAKQIARSGGVKSANGPHSNHVLARMEIWPDAATVKWEYIHEKYYGEAIGLLTRALYDIRLWPETHPSASNPAAPQKPPSLSDELMAATAILCEYEAMDAAMSASGVWQSHLAGAKSLLDIAEAGMYAKDGPDTNNAPKFAGARKAIFWNFARQDFAAAFITECQARLDVHNHAMWRAAGLELDSQGRLLPSLEFGNTTPSDNHSREDMLANSLILLLSKLNNYIVIGESLQPAGPDHSGPRYEDLMSGVDHLGISQQTLLERWSLISQEFDTWHANLPETFRPVKRISHPVFSEIWHSIPMCASAMQAYHMAKIILLINRPHETTARRTTIGTRLRSYRDIDDEVTHHGREICGIALARHECSVRIFSIQPLFVAGSCFAKREEQEVVMHLLEGIERELGWKTDYRRERLLEEWMWDRDGSANATAAAAASGSPSGSSGNGGMGIGIGIGKKNGSEDGKN